MADLIARLPTDDTAPTKSEIQVIEYLFDKDGSQKTARTMADEFRDALFLAVLFLIFSSQYFEILVVRYIPQASNAVIGQAIKAMCVVVVFYIYSNSALAKRKDLVSR